jgi:surface antigen
MWNNLVCGPVERLSRGLVALVAGCFALGSLPGPLRAQDVKPAEQPFCTCPNAAPNPTLQPNKAPAASVKPNFTETNAHLDENDEVAALEAIRVALTEVGDGNSYVWYRKHGRLSGIVQPTVSFKDPAGRVCRHILLIMTVGAATGRAEGIACRLGDGRWQLDG